MPNVKAESSFSKKVKHIICVWVVYKRQAHFKQLFQRRDSWGIIYRKILKIFSRVIMAGEIIVDALPYIDHGYDDVGVRESALAMVEEECRRYRPTKNYLDHLPQLNNSSFETKMMAYEFERIQNRQPMETLSMKRYELPPPSAGKLSEITAWHESIENSMAQLEHQWVRSMNLELMLDFGIESWKAYLEIFTALQAKAQNKLKDLKKQIQDINWQRKQAQTNAGEKLKTLEANWVMLVSKNYEIEQQCVELEKEIHALKDHLSFAKESDKAFDNNDYLQMDREGQLEVNENQKESESSIIVTNENPTEISTQNQEEVKS